MINLENASKKALFWLTILHWVLYAGFCLVAPCSVILTKYGMVGEKVYIISGTGICVLLIFMLLGLKLIRQQINKIAVDSYLWKARLRAILNLIVSIVVPVGISVITFLIKDNMELALSCIKLCVTFIIVGLVEDCVLGTSVERENLIMDNSKADKEKAKRTAKV